MCAILDGINEKIDPSCIEQCVPIDQSKLSEQNLSQYPDVLPAIVIGYMDVKALYPSIDIDHSSEVINKLINESHVNFECMCWTWPFKYLPPITQAQIYAAGLSDVIHKRKHKHGPKPTLSSKSVSGTDDEHETANVWVPPQHALTLIETKQMLALVISQAVTLVMHSHVYSNSDVIYKEMFGGVMGIQATCEVAN